MPLHVTTASGRVHAYVRRALQLAARDHGPYRELSPADLPPECADRVHELHDEMLAPLRTAIEELGVADAALVTALVLGAVSAGARAVEHGGDVDAVTARTVAFVDTGLGLG